MKNRLFQIAWNLLKPLIPRKKGSGASLEDYKERIFAQMNLAEKFGGPDLVILGDSNAENLSGKKWMDQFGEFGVAANIAISGTRPGQWEEFLRLNDHLWNQIWHAKYQVLNIGGNCILQGQFNTAKKQLLELYSLLPYSWNCLVPPVHYDILSKLTGDKDIESKFKQLNVWIKEIWGNRAIDTYTPFAMVPESIWFIEGDLVHFNDLGNKLRIPIIKGALRK